MKRWDTHWFGPVAAIRPYLFQRGFLLVAAIDMIVLMMERGCRYGLEPIPFNVPHFDWINSLHDWILPGGIPTATHYVCVLLVTSFLAFCNVIIGHRRWLMATVAILYTYAWSMSRLDSYLHHYMLSLILGCMVFFPRIDAAVLKDWWQSQENLEGKETRQSRKKKQKANTATTTTKFSRLAISLSAVAIVYRLLLSRMTGLPVTGRWIAMFAAAAIGAILLLRQKSLRTDWDDAGPHVGSWAFRLLGTTVGVIYIFTSIAKMDMEWMGGHTLTTIGTTRDVLMPVQQIANAIGISAESFWAALATFVIPLELTLATCYLISVRQDESSRKWTRLVCMFGWLLAIGLHLNNEMMNLIIQWFGYYMLLLATLFLLPAKILMHLGSPFIWAECTAKNRCRNLLSRFQGESEEQPSVPTLAIITFLAVGFALVFGYIAWIAGAIKAANLIATGCLILFGLGISSRLRKQSVKSLLTASVACLAMTIAVLQCTARFDYYDIQGKIFQNFGQHDSAIGALERAAFLPAPSDKASAEMMTNLGISYRRVGKNQIAELAFRRAIKLNPRQFLAHYSLANLMVEKQKLPEAESHYRAAIGIKSDFSDALVNLGNVLEFRNDLKGAIKCYEDALEIEPDAADVSRMLENAKARL